MVEITYLNNFRATCITHARFPETFHYNILLFCFSELNVNDLQMKELQDQLEAENYFSVSNVTYVCKLVS